MKEIFRLSKFLSEVNDNFQLIFRITLIKLCKINYSKKINETIVKTLI